MSVSSTPAARDSSAAGNMPITEALYGKKGQRQAVTRPLREGTGYRTFSVGSQLRQKLGGRAYGQLLDRLNRVAK